MAPNTERPAPIFVGESPALDFLNSIAAPKGSMIDWLETEASVLDWFEMSGLCGKAELARLRDGSNAADLTKVLQDLHAFRDLFRGFINEAAGKETAPISDLLVKEINDILLGGMLTMQIVETTQDRTGSIGSAQTHALKTQFELRTPRDLLVRIAAACAKLICETDFSCIRNCEGPTCTMYFLDVSKNRKRRWCSMSICGNRAKAAAHRKAKAASS